MTDLSRHIDIDIARRLLCWKQVWDKELSTWLWDTTRTRAVSGGGTVTTGIRTSLPRFSRSWSDMKLVLDRLIELGYRVRMWNDGEKWICEVIAHISRDDFNEAQYDDGAYGLPMAVCRAALQIKELLP